MLQPKLNYMGILGKAEKCLSSIKFHTTTGADELRCHAFIILHNNNGIRQIDKPRLQEM